MKTVVVSLCALLLLAGCQSRDLGDYHTDPAHPVRVAEAAQRLDLAGLPADRLAAEVGRFAAERPNNGSTFTIAAAPALATPVREALLRAGIDPRDICVMPDAAPPELVRTDRFASAVDCRRPPRPMGMLDYLFGADDGFAHDNSNSDLLGCSVKRNIIEMVDDPRALTGPVHGSGRDGRRAVDTQGKYGTGANPAAGYTLPTWSAGQ